MRKITLLLLSLLFCGIIWSQNKEKANSTLVTKDTTFIEKKDTRNVMMNAGAANNAGPRKINIGLPGQDIILYEDGMPVVPFFFPLYPTSIWRYDQSLGRMGLDDLSESMLISGKNGYMIDTYSRQGSRRFRGFSALKINNFSGTTAEINVSGPLKNNWFYSISTYFNTEPNIRNAKGLDPNKASLSKIFIKKAFNNRKGEVRFGAKYGYTNEIHDIYTPFVYHEGGRTSNVDNFDILSDSYMPIDTKYNVKDYIDGSEESKDLNNIAKTKTLVFVAGLKYKLRNNWKLDWNAQYLTSSVGFKRIVPIGSPYEAGKLGSAIGIPYPVDTKYADDGSDLPEGRDVQMSFLYYIPEHDYTYIVNRLDFTKKIDKHNFTIGSFSSFNELNDFRTLSTFFFHESAPNPRKVDAFVFGNQITNNGEIAYNSFDVYLDGSEFKTGIYASDLWNVSNSIDLSYGARINYQKNKISTFDNLSNPLEEADRIFVEKDYLYWSAFIKSTYKISKLFGLEAELYRNAETPNLTQWSNYKSVQDIKDQPTQFGKLGLFYNNKKINIVSSVNYISKKNKVLGFQVANPDNKREQVALKVAHDLSTIGWVTDFIAKPFKNFEFHGNFTWQKPEYANFNFTAFDRTLSYNGKVPTGISEVLVELDPSLYINKRKMKLWFSFRYFSKENIVPSNLLTFESRWETFGGFDWKINRSLTAKVKVINLFNTTGMKGEISDGQTLTPEDVSSVYNTTQVGSPLLPRTFELKLTYKF